MLGLSVGSSNSSVATSTVISQEISISHTNGTPSTAWNSGGGEANYSSAGAGGSGGSDIINLTGTWQSLLTAGQASALKVKSNIVAADISSAGTADVGVTLNQAYMTATGSATSGSRNSASAGRINDHGVALTSGPSYSTPGNVGDIGTYVLESLNFSTLFGHPGLVVGTNYLQTPTMLGYGIVSPGYWTYYFNIHADWPTKVYKFMLELEVEI